MVRSASAFVLALASAVATAQPAREGSAYAPSVTPTELGLAGYAKVLCSAVFVSGRQPEEAARNSGFFMLAENERDGVTWDVDREKQQVRMTRAGITRAARFYGDQGCIIQQRDREGVFFKPLSVKTQLPDAATQPWPMGDQPSSEPLPPEIDEAKLAQAVLAAFAPEGLTAGFVVVHRGRIVAERYMPGITKDTQLESWSMGKSITATLLGLLVADGTYALEQEAPVPEWRRPSDPRSKIKISDLLRMSSGLRFIAGQDPDYTPEMGYPDHMLIYTGAIDAFQHSISRPLQFAPGTEGRYRNSDPLTIGYLIKQALRQRGEEYLSWPQRALFDRIGIRRQVLETDPYGNFLLTGYDYGTARNWARLGLLYLNDGVWQGQRLLPAGFVKFVSSLAPAWKRPVYGGLFWVNGDGAWKLPKDAYFMAGAGGQRTFVVPSHQLVVARLGHFRGDRAGMQALNASLEMLLSAIRVPAKN